jgi:hypothetical protein
MARLSYEQLGPMILSYQRSCTRPYKWWGPTIMQLDHVNVKVADPDQLDSTRLERVIQFAGLLRSNHPFSRWSSLCRDRDYAFHVQGDYRATAIQTALAVEVQIYSVLSCLLWEQTFPKPPSDAEIESATKILDKDAQPLRAELGKLLGGDWNSPKSVSTAWQVKGAKLRNHAVHGGYRPSRQEAADAICAAQELDKFVRDRLARTALRNHRTAAMLLGEPGLERLEAMTQRVRALLDQSLSEPDWKQSYHEWRLKVTGV